jgi:hypothetical protein
MRLNTAHEVRVEADYAEPSESGVRFYDAEDKVVAAFAPASVVGWWKESAAQLNNPKAQF